MKNIFSLIIISGIFCSCSETGDSAVKVPNKVQTRETRKYEPAPPPESFANTQLRVELDEVYNSDQAIRNKFTEAKKTFGHDSKEVLTIVNEMKIMDSINCLKVTAILDKYGWLAPYEIGDQGNSALWLVIQHADLQTQEKYFRMMYEAVTEHKAKEKEFALLLDRVLIRRGEKQVYGSQLEWDSTDAKYRLAPILDEQNVNIRRASVGLNPIEAYAREFGIEYTSSKK